MTTPLRIVHCDDSADMLMLVEHWLEDHPDLDLVASALGMRQGLELVRRHQPDVVVTDTMGLSGSEDFLRWLRDAAPVSAIVLFTGYEEFQLGTVIPGLVDRVVTKRIDERELTAQLRSLVRGR